MAESFLFVGYATRLAPHGDRLRQVAETLAHDLGRRDGTSSCDASVRLCAVESQRELLQQLALLPAGSLRELHLVTPGSVYGPLLGKREWPEQLSRHEWRELRLPFTPGARAVFEAAGFLSPQLAP